MPRASKSGVASALEQLRAADPDVQEAAFAIMREDEEHSAFQAVKFFRDASPAVAAEVFGIIKGELAERAAATTEKKSSNTGRKGRKAASSAAADVANSAAE